MRHQGYKCSLAVPAAEVHVFILACTQVAAIMTVPVCLDLTQQSAVFEKHSHSLLLVDAAESLKSTDLTQGFNRVVEASEQQACASIQGIQQQDCKQTITVVISEDAEEAAGPGPYSKLLETVRRSRKVCSYAFIAVWARQAVEDPCLRVGESRQRNMIIEYMDPTCEAPRQLA